MSYSIQEFESKYLQDFKQLRLLEEEKKKLDELSKEAKSKLLDAMLEAGIKSIDNDFIKIMVTNPSTFVSTIFLATASTVALLKSSFGNDKAM